MLQRFGETAPEREIKFAPVDLKTMETDGTFSGYASLFNAVDLGREPFGVRRPRCCGRSFTRVYPALSKG